MVELSIADQEVGGSNPPCVLVWIKESAKCIKYEFRLQKVPYKR